MAALPAVHAPAAPVVEFDLTTTVTKTEVQGKKKKYKPSKQLFLASTCNIFFKVC